MTARAEAPVRIDVGPVRILGDLVVPGAAAGLVVFAHGSGSGRLSPRNRQVADGLNRRGLATLLIDLLTVQEERDEADTGALRFDIPFLAGRLAGAARWAESDPRTAGLPVGYFGASTGAAAALAAAAAHPSAVRAVVSRGGRPDLAGIALAGVRAPTLLIVGSADRAVLDLNRAALRALGAPARLAIVPGATHLFPEPGALERVTDLAGDWFSEHLPLPG